MNDISKEINSLQSEKTTNAEKDIKTRVFARLVSNELPKTALDKVAGGEWECYGTHNDKFIALDCRNS